MNDLNKNRRHKNRHIQILFIALGTFFVGVAVVGILIPVLPTTPFLLIAAALYARSSVKFYNWLINNKVFGRYIRDYREGKGIPLKVKITILALLWITIGFSAFFTGIFWIKFLLVIVAIGVTIHITGIEPKDKAKKVLKR